MTDENTEKKLLNEAMSLLQKAMNLLKKKGINIKTEVNE